MERQKRLIYNSDWTMAMILDACRYDFFEDIHSEFLDGGLTRVKSEGGYTKKWFENTFTTPMADVVYINSNPPHTLQDTRLGKPIPPSRRRHGRRLERRIYDDVAGEGRENRKARESETPREENNCTLYAAAPPLYGAEGYGI